MGNHFSAPVIYGVAFILLSIYLEGKGIKKSLNFFSTSALSLMSIGVYEWMWNLSYAVFQNQWWSVSFNWKQGGNTICFTLFIVIGILTMIYLHLEGYRFNFGVRTLSFLTISLLLWGVWINYPLPTQKLSVQTTAGLWTSSSQFPQTYYAVDVDPLDRIAIGDPFWVENNILHLLNLSTKIMMTLTILSMCLIRRELEAELK